MSPKHHPASGQLSPHVLKSLPWVAEAAAEGRCEKETINSGSRSKKGLPLLCLNPVNEVQCLTVLSAWNLGKQLVFSAFLYLWAPKRSSAFGLLFSKFVIYLKSSADVSDIWKFSRFSPDKQLDFVVVPVAVWFESSDPVGVHAFGIYSWLKASEAAFRFRRQKVTLTSYITPRELRRLIPLLFLVFDLRSFLDCRFSLIYVTFWWSCERAWHVLKLNLT